MNTRRKEAILKRWHINEKTLSSLATCYICNARADREQSLSAEDLKRLDRLMWNLMAAGIYATDERNDELLSYLQLLFLMIFIITLEYCCSN